MNLICKNCGKTKDSSKFSQHKGCKSGFDISRYKLCKKSALDYSKVSIEKRMYHRAKSRDKSKNIEFDLEFDDIVIPEIWRNINSF